MPGSHEILADVIYIGTAGWSLPKEHLNLFSKEGSHLQRYSQTFNAVEINSSFYRDHLAKTYTRWKDEVSADFKFSVKLSRFFTHERRTKFQFDVVKMKEVLEGVQKLEEKLGVILVQLPSRLIFEKREAEKFFKQIRQTFNGSIVFEPRHLSWTEPKALEILEEFKLNPVCADPLICPFENFKKSEISYHRLHGSPVIYESRYEKDFLENLESTILKDLKRGQKKEIWVIFDNTKWAHATENAHHLLRSILNQKAN